MYYLKYNDINLPCTVDFAVIKSVCAKLKIKLTAFESTVDDPSQTEVIVFEALKRGHQLEGKEFGLKEAYMTEILSTDGNYFTFMTMFTECVLKMFSAPQDDKKK